ncbi:MAG: ABC-2 transporter permease [Emergencia timonensis]|uniref:ABC-2 transporter permease n=1 Tax=Emergencia timonensis TaxID=1776384 RepID=UPI0008324416|nr:ABC-2 transporter permease [Emergencia timonensis]WNX87802.1 ABC-2 transporter permease [Emergencia timonensis]
MNNLQKTLIKKDLLFSCKLAPIFLICAAAISVYGSAFACGVFARPQVTLSTAVIVAVLVYLSAICYLEDNPETEGFLDALPIVKCSRVFSRYAVMLLQVIAALAIAAAAFVIAGGGLAFGDVMWVCAITLALYSMFLYVFFQADLQTAQYVPATVLLAGAVAMKARIFAVFALPAGYGYAALPAAVIVFAVCAKRSAKV